MRPSTFAVMLVVLAAFSVSGQTTTQAGDAGLKIVRVELQRTTLKSPSLRAVAGTDPATQKKAQTDRGQDGNSDNIPALHRMSQNAEIAPKTSKQDPLGNMPSSDPVIFVASVLVKNIGTKTVTNVQWEYLLFEKGSKEPIKRYRIDSKKIIPPGEQAELTKEVTPKGQEQQARILRIQYGDGTFWHQ
jgi:hypothetical protein